jgi:SAM-dependent methyltransferase
VEISGVRERTDRFFVANLEQGLPEAVGTGYDVVIVGDLIEHLSRPTHILKQIRAVLTPGGEVLLSVPNFGHWYPRARVLTGRFGYDRRGILDDTHLRFFTRSTLRRTVRAAGFDIVEEVATGLPLGVVTTGETGRLALLRLADDALVHAWPNLFGYQHVMRLTPHAADVVYADQFEAAELSHSDEKPA